DGHPLVVVHGGGNIISRWQKLHGIEARFIRGLRVTDGPGLEVATAVLAGLVNKELVASIQGAGGGWWGSAASTEELSRRRSRTQTWDTSVASPPSIPGPWMC
ncbi:MAG: acetylglutamate kinase, partial [Chloroflexi bacterium]|nr:acetylglutamate kinase [Chloroflexota bacterium]